MVKSRRKYLSPPLAEGVTHLGPGLLAKWGVPEESLCAHLAGIAIAHGHRRHIADSVDGDHLVGRNGNRQGPNLLTLVVDVIHVISQASLSHAIKHL